MGYVQINPYHFKESHSPPHLLFLDILLLSTFWSLGTASKVKLSFKVFHRTNRYVHIYFDNICPNNHTKNCVVVEFASIIS